MNETGSITVSELNLLIADAIRKEPRTRSLTVRGEVSGFRHYVASGHWYFSLKDEESAVSCVMFRQNTLHAKMMPRDGERILVSGYVDAYPKNGTYQLYVTALRPDGTGDLFLRFEELKRRLSAEGLFDPAQKRPLPMMPGKVAVVTSVNGAALHDILNVSGHRCPAVPIVVIPATVQGEKAAAEIVSGIRAANEKTSADVLIIARGGGSAEDLWCFNDESIARAVAGSRIPVVSGVGHETDLTICDLAADVRASTPSNAAEIVFPDKSELRGRTDALRAGLQRAAEKEWNRAASRIRENWFRLNAASPEKRITRLTAETRLRETELIHTMGKGIENASVRIRIEEKELASALLRRTEAAETRILRMRERLEAINPLRVLERGYTLVTDMNGQLLAGSKQAEKAKDVLIRFSDGTVAAEVKEGRETHP